MALIKEDGTGLATANSYADVNDFKDWADDRAIDYASFPDIDIAGALVTATTWIDTRYTFKGTELNDTQALRLPTDTVSVTPNVIKATCQAAHYHLSGLLMPLAINTGIKSQRKKLDVLETETVYQDGATQKQSYSIIDGLLKKYTLSGGGIGVVFNGV